MSILSGGYLSREYMSWYQYTHIYKDQNHYIIFGFIQSAAFIIQNESLLPSLFTYQLGQLAILREPFPRIFKHHSPETIIGSIDWSPLTNNKTRIPTWSGRIPSQPWAPSIGLALRSWAGRWPLWPRWRSLRRRSTWCPRTVGTAHGWGGSIGRSGPLALLRLRNGWKSAVGCGSLHRPVLLSRVDLHFNLRWITGYDGLIVRNLRMLYGFSCHLCVVYIVKMWIWSIFIFYSILAYIRKLSNFFIIIIICSLYFDDYKKTLSFFPYCIYSYLQIMSR